MIAAMISQNGSQIDMALDFGISVLGAISQGELAETRLLSSRILIISGGMAGLYSC
jgi:hypothetical protein